VDWFVIMSIKALCESVFLYCQISILKLWSVTMRTKITLACSECKQRNYDSFKNKKNDPDRLEMSKFCRFCGKHTPHKETK